MRDEKQINIHKSLHLKQFIQRNSIYAVNESPLCKGANYTYITSHTMLDYILVDEVLNSCLNSCEIIEEGCISNTSDHLPVVCRFTLPHSIPEFQAEDVIWTAWHKSTDEHMRAYQDTVRRSLENTCQREITTIEQLDCANSTITNCLISSAQQSLPNKIFNKHTKPYWTADVKEKHRLERGARIKWVTAGRPRTSADQNYETFKHYKSMKKRFSKQPTKSEPRIY